MKKVRKLVSMLLVFAMTFSMAISGKITGITQVSAREALGSNDFLKVNGTQIRKQKGTGDVVYLRGTNAGGWLVQEDWMNPTNASDQKTMMTTLANRFGTSKRDELVSTYENNYWTTQDFDNCAEMGMSVIRLPFTYMNLCDDNGNLKSNAFDRLDWFVQNCSQRGMYVILDMHGAFGSQNGMDHSGEINDGKQLYYNQNNKDKTLNLWKKIAEHFKGNPAVAAYDILNEPGIKAAATYSLHWDFYNEIYNAIRSKDSNHIIIMESCWDADNLPRPSQYGWTNVAYEYHYYPWSAQNSSDAQKSYFSSKVSDIANHNYGVPTFVGEFTCFEQEEGWKAAMSTFNGQGWHWTTWSYKVTGNSSWGIYNHNPEKVDIYNDSADTIKNKWSAVGTANGWKNDKIYNLVKPYLSGTVTSTGGSTTDDSDNNSTSGVATLYEHSNYGGRAVSLEEGSYDYKDILAKGIVNDQISSLRVSDGYKVTIYDDEGFKGKSKEFTSDASYVGDEMNDKTSSIKIEKINNQTSTTTSYDTVKLPNGKYSIKSVANEKYVAAENGGSDPIVANRDSYSGSWETFYIVNNDDGTVSIKADANNKYVCAVLDEENQLTPRSNSISTWEKFKIYKINDSEYGIRSAENRKYVKADLDKGGKLIAGSDSIAGAWEAFHIEKVGDTTNDNVATFYENSNYGGWSVSLSEGTYNYRDIIAKGIKNDAISSLKVNSGYKVTLYNDEGFNGTSKAFTGDASYVGDEMNDKTSSIKIEKWNGSSSVTYNTVKLSNGKYSIKSVANEKYVAAENGGSETIVANRDNYGGSWETFYLINNDDGTVSIKADANNKYVCAVLDEENQLVPRSDNVGTWEKFQIYKINDSEYGIRSAENGKYVKADLDNGGKLIAGSDSIAGAWETFNIEKLGDETSSAKATFYENSNYSGWSVALSEGRYDYGTMISKGIKNDQISSIKVADGYKVTLYNDAGFAGSKKTLLTDASGLGDFNDKTSAIVIEKVEKADFNNSNTYIRSIANGQVVCAENGGSETIVANRSSCGGAWETFQIVNNNDGTVSLRSVANGKYVCAVIDENNQLLPRSGSIGTWEKFIIEKISNGEYALYSLANGKYVQANLNDGGKLFATSETVAGAWEVFDINRN
ncbi:MAG: cellulase family glycosylhydrolase [Eubacterium sp.]|nr:cellulase family glycosylhydrolase [Eubacterium sp.]